MRKLLFISALLLVAIISHAQSDSTGFIKKIQYGITFGGSANTAFMTGKTIISKTEKPLNGDVFLDAIISTEKTRNYFLYGYFAKTAYYIPAYELPNDWEIFCSFAKNVTNSEGSIGIGIEKIISIGKLRPYLYSEIDSDLRGGKTLSVGILLGFQATCFKRN